MTDPTITIAGLRAQVATLIDHLDSANTSRGDFSSLYSQHSAKVAAAEAERDALAAQLAEVRAEMSRRATDGDGRVSAICRALGIDESGNDHPVDAIEAMRVDIEMATVELRTAQRDLASERARLAACRIRIAGLEQAANERSAEVARLTDRVAEMEAETRTPCNGSCDIALASRQVGPDGIVPRNARECAELWEREAARLWREETRLTARVAELEARPVLTVEAAVAAAKSAGWSSSACRDAETVVGAILASLGPVTLPAQDRAEELANAYVDEWNGNGDCRGDAQAIAKRTAAMHRALASLGAPPTSPTAVANRLATEAAALLRKIARIGALAQGGEQSPNAAECIDVARRLEQEQNMRPTSPPAARPVFAGVSVQDLRDAYEKAYRSTYDERIKAIRDSGERPAQMPSRPEIALRAVLARLGATLVAPVDPEAVARDFQADLHQQDPDGWTPFDSVERGGQAEMVAAMRAALTAAGIPVTPEVRK